jgi:hypothetical protein
MKVEATAVRTRHTITVGDGTEVFFKDWGAGHHLSATFSGRQRHIATAKPSRRKDGLNVWQNPANVPAAQSSVLSATRA